MTQLQFAQVADAELSEEQFPHLLAPIPLVVGRPVVLDDALGVDAVDLDGNGRIDRVVADLDLVAMGQTASSMVSQVMVALVKRDADAAKHILAMDDDLDAMHARSYRVLKDTMQQQPDIVHQAVSYLTISSNLERLGDLATNIAEEIIFMEEGEVVRHLDGVPLD